MANATFNEQYACILFPTQPITPAKKRAKVELLQRWNLLAANPQCLNGHGMMLERRNNVDGWRWKCHRCRTTRGLRSGTFFEDFRTDLGRLAYAIYLWTLRITGKEISAMTGIHQNDIVRLRQNIRTSCFFLLFLSKSLSLDVLFLGTRRKRGEKGRCGEIYVLTFPTFLFFPFFVFYIGNYQK